MNTPSKEDLDNLFGPMFEEYFGKKSSDTSINSPTQPTQLHEYLPSTSSINIKEHEAPPIETTSYEQTSPISLPKADELHQEDSADCDGNSQFVSHNPKNYKTIESSSTALEPSNVHNFHQVRPSTDSWIKDHPLDQVISDPSKPVMTRQRLHTDFEDSGFDLIAYSDANHVGCKDDCKSTLGGLQFLALPKERFEYLVHRIADGHPDELCPPNKRFFFCTMDSYGTVPAYFVGRRLKVYAQVYARQEKASLTLDDFGIIFYLPQETNKNHDSFVPPPSFYDMIPFYKNHLGFTMELKTPSSFKTIGLLQPAAMGRNSLFSSSFNIFDSLSKIHGMCLNTHTFDPEIQRQSWNEDSRLDNLRRDEANEALTDGTHRTPSAPRSPTAKVDASASIRSIVIHLRLPQRKSTRLTPPAPVLTADKADELILHDTLQVSLADHKSRQEQEAKENVVLVEKHLAYEEIEKMVEGQEHVVGDSSIPRNDEHNIPGTRLEPRSDKESPEVGITDVIIHVNVYDKEEEEDEITDEELQGHYIYLFEHLRSKFMPRKSFVTLADHFHEAMADSLPLWSTRILKSKLKMAATRHSNMIGSPDVELLPLGQEIRAILMMMLILGGRKVQSDRRYQNDYDFSTDSYASNDDEIPTKQVSQDIMEEVSLNVDEAKLKKITDEMLIGRFPPFLNSEVIQTANGDCLSWGEMVEVMGSRVVMEMGEWSGKKSYTAFGREKVHV
nr:hypothetical protein [Tanacetum cinerariifolium]